MWQTQWQLTPTDFLTKAEVERLRNFIRRRAFICKRWNRLRVLEYMIIETGLQTGLRVKELSELNCGDIMLNGSMSFIKIRNGKGGSSGVVRIGKKLEERLQWYLGWKQAKGDLTGKDDPFFRSSHTQQALKKRAIQNIFVRCCKRAGIERPVHTHMMRHTYASILYAKSGHNLRLVQTQLRHKSSRTTEVYANVLSDAYKALDNLYD